MTDPTTTPTTTIAAAEDPVAEWTAAVEAAESAARAAIAAASDLDGLRAAEAAATGKRSVLARLHARLGAFDQDQRRAAGQVVNDARRRLTDAVSARREALDAEARRRRLDAERLDLTETLVLGGGDALGLPDRGHLHLVTQTRDELEDTFVALGFAVAEGPEAETDWYNFEALNMPPDHPARGMWDTLYLKLGEPETVLLRTHTSPVQVRLMQSQEPPIYAVMPGRCYRRDTPDARHLPVFHQIEGLVVDRGITFGDLAGTIEAFTTAFFGPGIHSRLRPSYFPFTEPSAEFEITCPICAGAGCRTCSASGWIELGGCGMVDPNVFAAVGIDAELYSGFAFGFGIDRLAQMRARLADMRMLLDNDLRFLTQF
ncbi:MAG: phenylalanine--tRNA ligase subunit alpha [Acidimicrobiales bacterium]